MQQNIKNKQIIISKTVELIKVEDKKGEVVKNKQLDSNKNSRNGIDPYLTYYKDNSKTTISKIGIVKKVDKKELFQVEKAYDNEIKQLNKKIKETYLKEVTKSKIITEKNMLIAKIESSRLINKAIIIEKEYLENKLEKERHNSVNIKIKEFKNQLLENNDFNLQEQLTKIEIVREIELENNNNQRDLINKKIAQQIEINKLNEEWKRRRIDSLSKGKKFDNKDKNQEKIKNTKTKFSLEKNQNVFYKINENFKVSEDKQRIADKEKNKKSINSNLNKFEQLSKKIKISHDKNNNLKNKLIKQLNSKHYIIIDQNEYNKILNAKKERPFVTMTVKNLVNDSKTLHEYYDTKKSTNKQKDNLVIKNKEKSFDEKFFQKDVSSTIHKFKKINKNIVKSFEYDVDKINDNLYSIDYIKKTNNKNIRTSSKKQLIENKDMNIKNNNNKTYSKIVVLKLKNKINSLPNDPIIVEYKDFFVKEKIELSKTINEFNKFALSNLEINEKNDKLISDVYRIFDIYNDLTKKDVKNRNNIIKSQIYSEKLEDEIAKKEAKLISYKAKNNNVYYSKNQSIENKYEKSKINSKNKHLINKEAILENEINQIKEENECSLRNKAYNIRTSYDICKNNFKYENKNIYNTIKSVEKYNKKSSNKIKLDGIPFAINSFESIEENNIQFFKKDGNVLLASNCDKKNYSKNIGKVINKEIPNNVTKIVVLDKFRNISDPLTRSAMLLELASCNYARAIKFNSAREKAEIAILENKIIKSIKKVDSLVEDSIVMNHYRKRLLSESNLNDQTKKTIAKSRNLKWKLEDKNNLSIKNKDTEQLKMLERKNKKLDSNKLRIQSNNKISNHNDNNVNKNTILNRINNIIIRKPKPDIDEIIGKKNNNTFKKR